MDRITYCADIYLLIEEAIQKGYHDSETDTFTHGMALTPIKYNGDKSLSLVRGDIVEFDNLQILGTYEEIFASPSLDAKYKSVHPYDVPVIYLDEDGNEKSYMRPKKIGEFA